MSTPYKYLLCLLFPICVLLFLATGPHPAITALSWTLPLWIIIIIDWFSPKIQASTDTPPIHSLFYDILLYSLALIQFLNIWLMLVYASQLTWHNEIEIANSIINLMVLRILVGSSSGSSAIIVAHEFIHRANPIQKGLGHLLLISVCYDHFVIAHINGHHYKVATPEDIATARIDESFEQYWRRVYRAHFQFAWQFEQHRLRQNTKTFNLKTCLKNKVLIGLVIEFLCLVLFVVVYGWIAALIFLYQAVSGVRLLETINYYQHWGLEQGKSQNAIAWVNQSSFTQYALLGLSNHISHHKNPIIHYPNLPYSESGPKMPHGYFVTNLWVKLNNASYRKHCKHILNHYPKELLRLSQNKSG